MKYLYKYIDIVLENCYAVTLVTNYGLIIMELAKNVQVKSNSAWSDGYEYGKNIKSTSDIIEPQFDNIRERQRWNQGLHASINNRINKRKVPEYDYRLIDSIRKNHENG